MHINEKYYNGFEGDEEIVFRLYIRDKEKEQLGIWGGYFNSIVELIKPDDKGWTGLAYYYHLDIGWYEEENWKIPDIELAYRQLLGIYKNIINENEKKILNIILKLLKKALKKCGFVTISSY